MSKWSLRTAAIATGAAAVMAVSAQQAVAVENIYISSYYGSMTFIDDGDVFQVCDTYPDGSGVKGYIKYQPIIGSAGIIGTLDDGGDAGCDKLPLNVGNDGDYQMIFCGQMGLGECVSSRWFNE
jgi:hypothetical protein